MNNIPMNSNLHLANSIGGTAWPNVKVWNFDTSSNTLTIGSTKLKVQREVDWEAGPRKLTIVYSGLSGSKSFWGKKK